MTATPLFAIALAIAAQTTADSETEAPDRDDEIVVTATRTETPLDKIGSSVTVLDRETIARSQEEVVSDLLVQVPGVSFSRNGGIGGATSVRIRGAEADQTVLLIDGIKLNDPSTPGGGFNFANLATRNIDRIEVLRGPQSTLWGSQAIGGVVNVITTPPGEDRIDLTVEGGSRGTAQARGGVSGRTGRLGYAAAGGYFRTDGISAFAKTLGGRERDGYRNAGANGRLTYDLTDDVGVDVRGWYSRGRNKFDSPPRDTADVGKTREAIGYAAVRAGAFGGGLRNRVLASLTRTKRDNFNPDLPVQRTFDALGRNDRLEYQGEADIARGVSAVFGAETERQRFRTASPTAADPNPAPLRGKIRLNSVYGQLAAEPVAGLSLTAGIRQDDHSLFGDATTGRVTGAYTPDGGGLVARASYGTGFKAPTLFQLLSQFGNPDLDPERGRGWDVSLEQNLAGDRLTFGVTYFGRRSTDLIDFVSCFRNADPRCRTQPNGFYENISRTKVKGLEVFATAQPLRDLILRGHYTLTNADNASNGAAKFGNTLPRRPRHLAFGEATYRLPFGLEASAAVTRTGASFDDAANNNRLDDYTLVDVRLRYAVTRSLQLFGRVDNVFDEGYETTRRYGSPGRGAFVGVSMGL